ncbi:MAG: hypothetical protein GXO74_11830 [Calditrichaeota bacterium]|nr:hypothetical protein [Calditrichota bacterium]
MKEMLEKLYHLITKNIFISDIFFFLSWAGLNYYRENFARLVRWAIILVHLWANIKFHITIRTHIASIYYFLNTDKFLMNLFEKNTEWVRGFMGGLAYLTWLLFFLAPPIVEFMLDRRDQR